MDEWWTAFFIGMVIGASSVLVLVHAFLPNIMEDIAVTTPHLKVD